MPRFVSPFVSVSRLCALFVVAVASRMPAEQPHPEQAVASASRGSQVLPLVFEENLGQMPEGTAFTGRTPSYTVEVRSSDLKFHLLGANAGREIDLAFTGSQGGRPAGVQDAGFRTNRYLGSDPRGWQAGIRNFDRVALRELYPGIDAEFYAHDGKIEHDFLLAAGADPSLLGMHIAGAEQTRIDAAGDLLLMAPDGVLRLHRPVAYQVDASGKRTAIRANFVLLAGVDTAEVHFTLGTYDHTRELVIDPVISYATYVGGSTGSAAAAIASDAAGNVYMTGSTGSSKASFGAVSIPTGAAPDPTQSIAYVARLSAGDSGSQIAWLTFYGSPTATTRSTALALQPGGGLVYVGGQTGGIDLPLGSNAVFDATPVKFAMAYGFVAGFNAADGVFNQATYVDGRQLIPGGVTSVAALATDASGVLIAANTTGSRFPTSSTPAPLIAAADPLLQNELVSKGILLRLDANLATELYGTYLCGDTCASSQTVLTGVAIDPAAAGAAYAMYVSGYTDGDFPRAGTYVAANPSASPPVTASQPSMYQPVPGKQGSDGFAARILPNSQTLSYSVWSGGASAERINALAVDGNNNLTVVGETASTALLSSLTVSSTTTPSPKPVATPLDSVFPPNAGTSGFAASVDGTGNLFAKTFLGGSYTGGATTASSTANAVAADAAGNLYIAGQTNAPKIAFPQQTTNVVSPATTGNVTEPLLPAGQDFSQDSTASTSNPRTFLVQMPAGLASVNYLAWFGPSAGTSSGIGVAVDSAANAYILSLDNTLAAGPSYTSASAIQQTPQIGSGVSGYVAQVAFATPGTSALTPVTGLCSIGSLPCSAGNPAGFQSPTNFSKMSLIWQVTNSGTGSANTLVFSLPPSANLLPYTSVPTVSVAGAAQNNVCTLSSSSNPAPGITCILPAVAAGATVQFALITGVGGNAPATFPVTAKAYDAQGDSATLTTTVFAAGVPTLALAVVATPGTVNAALATDPVAGGTPNTLTTYTFSLSNSSAFDSPSTTLSTALAALTAQLTPVGQPLITLPVGSSTPGCDLITIPCDIPAGTTLTYTVSGQYLAAQFGATAFGPSTSTFATAPSATASIPAIQTQPSSTATYPATGGNPISPVVTIMRNSNVSAIFTPPAFTYPSPATGFQLGDSTTFILTLTNTGPNQSGAGSVLVTLPKGFAATPPTGCAASAPVYTCSFAGLNGGGGRIVYAFAGTFTDSGTGGDAVAPPGTAGANPTLASLLAAVAASPVVSSGLTLQAGGLTVASYNAATAPNPQSIPITVTRVNALSYKVTATPVPAKIPLPANTVNELNTQDYGDQVQFAIAVGNSGKSVARGMLFTIPLPFDVGATAVPGPLAAPPGMTCFAQTAQVVCYTNDLIAPATPATATSYVVSFNATFSELTVPANVPTTSIALPQTSATEGLVYAAAFGYLAGVNGSPWTPAALTVQRSTQLIQAVTFSVTANASALLNYQPVAGGLTPQQFVNLQEAGTGNAPGVHDTVNLTLTTWNLGPNDAAGVVVTFMLPNYFTITSAIPSNCTFAGSNTSPISGNKLTCTMPVPAMNSQIQLLTCAPTCTSTTPPAGTGQLYLITLTGKFVDNGGASDTVAQAAPINTAASLGTAVATGNDVDPYTGSNGTATAGIAVVRVAHLKLSTPLLVTDTSVVTIPTSNTLTQAGQEAPLASGSGTLRNCIRYVFTVTNSGTNIANQPLINYTTDFLPPNGFVRTAMGAGAGPSLSPINCASSTPSASLPALAPGASSAFYVDGYFAQGTLRNVNSLAASAAVHSFSYNFFYDTAVNANPGTEATTGSSNATSVLVVNTPYNLGQSGLAFLVSPFYVAPCTSAPQVTLTFTSVTSNGITTPCTSTTTTAALPSGTSPYPPDKLNAVATRTLYQPGAHPVYYNLNTTASVPTTTNPTTVCVAQASGLPDVFVKPERALLWALLNAPSGTTFNAVPNITSTAPIGGDITSNVVASGTTTYVALPAVTFPQAPQAQPAKVCGQVNGFTPAGPSGGPVLAVLEPINFPPYVVAGAAPTSNQASKGSTAALSDVYLQVGSSATHDYNDKDPCYLGGSSTSTPATPSSRLTCDDNPFLYAWIFAGGNNGSTPISAPLAVATLAPETNANVISKISNAYLVGTGYNLGTATEAFVAVSDQATGADLYNANITVANPYQHQGNYLTSMSQPAGSVQPVCDPGSATAGYVLSAKPCAAVFATQTASQIERYVLGGPELPVVVSTITGYSIASNVVTFTAPNAWAAGQVLSLSGFAASTFFNGQTVTVLASGLSATQFQVAFTHIPVASTQETATASTVVPLFVLGNVGASAVIGTGVSGSGLISLPFPSLSTPPTSTPTPLNLGGSSSLPLGTAGAVATVTPGQTAGFIWTWLSGQTSVAGVPGGASPNDNYTLGCNMVDAATQSIVSTPPAGLTCTITTSTPTSANQSPTTYTFRDPNASNPGSTDPTIYVITNGNQYALNRTPGGKLGSDGAIAVLLLPAVLGRRKLRRGLALLTVLLSLGLVTVFSGCGSSSSLVATGAVAPPGTYYFRVAATPAAGAKGTAPITSAVFAVVVQNPN